MVNAARHARFVIAGSKLPHLTGLRQFSGVNAVERQNENTRFGAIKEV